MLFSRTLIKTSQSARNIVVHGPQSVKLTTMDRVIHGSILAFSILSVPIYVTYSFKDLRER